MGSLQGDAAARDTRAGVVQAQRTKMIATQAELDSIAGFVVSTP